MDNADLRLQEIADHLFWIRWELALLVLLVGLLVVGVVAAARQAAGQPKVDVSRSGQHLLNQGRYAELVKLALEHVAANPGDANVHWLLAQAQVRLGNYSEALIYARKTQALQPDWEASFTGPLIGHLEERLANEKHTPDLRIVSPDGAPEPDAPAPGGRAR